MSNTIGKHKGNISHLRFANRAADFFELLVDIEVESLDHLANIIAALRTDSLITSIEREGA